MRDVGYEIGNRCLICVLNPIGILEIGYWMRHDFDYLQLTNTPINMDQITTRKASLNDLPALLRFEQGVIVAERPFDPTLKDDPLQYYDLSALIASPDAELIVAESGTELIGCGYARIETSKHYLKHRQHAYLGFMYVDPEHRGKGVIQLIVKALKKWTLLKGLTEIRLEVYNGNAAAIRAYEKAGFTRNLLEMRMGLKNE